MTIRKTATLGALAVLGSTTLAVAQAPAARPATPPATTPAPTASAPVNASLGGAARNAATSAAAARAAFDAKVKASEATCKAKGPLYSYKPPHAVGDAIPGNPGMFYTSHFSGSCRRLVTARQIEALQAAGMLAAGARAN